MSTFSVVYNVSISIIFLFSVVCYVLSSGGCGHGRAWRHPRHPAPGGIACRCWPLVQSNPSENSASVVNCQAGSGPGVGSGTSRYAQMIGVTVVANLGSARTPSEEQKKLLLLVLLLSVQKSPSRLLMGCHLSRLSRRTRPWRRGAFRKATHGRKNA